MSYHDGPAPSWGSKASLLTLVLLGTLFSTYSIMMSDRLALARQGILVAFVWLFFIRLAVCLLVFLKRKLSWFEGISVGILYGAMLSAFASWGTQHVASIVALDAAAIVGYLGGSWINTRADQQRYAWKQLPENAGRLYTKGLFRHSMHINFFGDTLMFIGFAMITHDVRSFIPVAAIVANFILLQIPKLDDYLRGRYGQEFVEYSSRTRSFVPLPWAR